MSFSYVSPSECRGLDVSIHIAEAFALDLTEAPAPAVTRTLEVLHLDADLVRLFHGPLMVHLQHDVLIHIHWDLVQAHLVAGDETYIFASP
jgi:hypothetical protein